MSQQRLPPPPAPTCLLRRYPSSQKGGTIVVEDVHDLATHRERLCSPDGYRPKCCPRCQHPRLHVHDYRERVLRADAEAAVTAVVRHLCPNCTAIWLILPLFIARWLWRTWRVVEAQTVCAPRAIARPVPRRTVRRWRARLDSAAHLATQTLASGGSAALERLASVVGLNASREDLVSAHRQCFADSAGEPLAALAGLMHRLAAGIRLM